MDKAPQQKWRDRAKNWWQARRHENEERSAPVDIPDPDDLEPDWKKKSWASRASKKEEVYKPVDAKGIEFRRKLYEADPDGYQKIVQKGLDRKYCDIMDGIYLRQITVLADIDNPETNFMQEMINTLALAAGVAQPTPQLVIHHDDSYCTPIHKEHLRAMFRVPQFIETNYKSFNHYLKHPDQFKACMAHELAHFINRDVTLESEVKRNTAPSPKMEILAERLGAIIHGNPLKYAQDMAEFTSLNFGGPVSESNEYYLSLKGNLRMTHKWAEILADYRWKEDGHPWNNGRGATNENGDVILEPDANGEMRPLRALEVYEISKDKVKRLKLDMAGSV